MCFLARLAGVIAVAILVMAPVSPAFATDSAAKQAGKVKINLSGRQRMLTQRMAKGVCFAAIGVSPEQHMRMVEESFDLFDITLIGLRHGDPRQGLTPEDAPEILDQLVKTQGIWERYGQAVRSSMYGGNGPRMALGLVAQLNLPAMEQMDRAVQAFEAHYGVSGALSPEEALTLNIAGRQRMLSQKASKEFCMIRAGIDVANHRASLAKTLEAFDTSLNALLNGSGELGIPAAPAPQIVAQLRLVQRYWAPMKDILSRVASGGTPTDEELQRVAEENNIILFEMNRAVVLYQSI